MRVDPRVRSAGSRFLLITAGRVENLEKEPQGSKCIFGVFRAQGTCRSGGCKCRSSPLGEANSALTNPLAGFGKKRGNERKKYK